MLIHPNESAKTQITNVDGEMVQMHALDIRIDRLYKLVGSFTLSNEGKSHRRIVEVYPNKEGYFELDPETLYQFDTIHKVEMAEGEAGWIIGRSTLQRNGIIVQSALYDAGYKGGVNGTIFNTITDYAKIEKGARIGQFILAKADTHKLYTGDYNER